MAATDTHATIKELLEAVVSVRSVPRLYNEGQLPLERSLRRQCEMAASLVVSEWSAVNWFVSE
jgi:hypothetical protein